MKYAIIAVLAVFLGAGLAVAAPCANGLNPASLGALVRQLILDTRMPDTALPGGEELPVLGAELNRNMEKEPYASQGGA